MAEKTPLYTGSLLEAHRNGEVEQWRESHRANIRCKKAIENAHQSFDEWSTLEGVTADMIRRFGPDRIHWVLANTIQHLGGQFTQSDRAWAASFDIPRGAAYDTSRDFAVYAPSRALDHFTEAVRGLQAAEPEPVEEGGMYI